jgi:hypothetical protein
MVARVRNETDPTEMLIECLAFTLDDCLDKKCAFVGQP